MTPEEDPALREATRLFYEQVLATRPLRTEVEGLERRRAAGEAVDEAGLAVKRAELAAAVARRDALDRDVAAAAAPAGRAQVGGVTAAQWLASGLVVYLRERYKADPERAAQVEAHMTRLLPTIRDAADLEREVMALLAKLEDPDAGPT
jgi:hypothetical protein